MNAVKVPTKRKVIGVSFQPDELTLLERQRRQLGVPTKSAGLKLLWEHFGEKAVALISNNQTVAASATQQVQPLAAAVNSLGDAVNDGVYQRRKIGTNVNQIARLTNALMLDLREGGSLVTNEQVEDLVLALHGIERQLAELVAVDVRDDQAHTAVRALTQQIRATL